MKVLWRCFSLSLFLVSTGQAAVLLEKVTLPGFVLPQRAIVQKCTINDNGQIVKQFQLAGMQANHVLPVQLSLKSIKAKINQAAGGKITSSIIAVDGPSFTYTAYQMQANGTAKSVLLYKENGGAGTKAVNNSLAAQALSNFIDLNCAEYLLY